MWVLFAQQKTLKTANKNSIINFYFVTCFYSKYDICMVDKKTVISKSVLKLNYVAGGGFAISILAQ